MTASAMTTPTASRPPLRFESAPVAVRVLDAARPANSAAPGPPMPPLRRAVTSDALARSVTSRTIDADLVAHALAVCLDRSVDTRRHRRRARAPARTHAHTHGHRVHQRHAVRRQSTLISLRTPSRSADDSAMMISVHPPTRTFFVFIPHSTHSSPLTIPPSCFAAPLRVSSGQPWFRQVMTSFFTSASKQFRFHSQFPITTSLSRWIISTGRESLKFHPSDSLKNK
jgi:hypothetical protein